MNAWTNTWTATFARLYGRPLVLLRFYSWLQCMWKFHTHISLFLNIYSNFYWNQLVETWMSVLLWRVPYPPHRKHSGLTIVWRCVGVVSYFDTMWLCRSTYKTTWHQYPRWHQHDITTMRTSDLIVWHCFDYCYSWCLVCYRNS